MLKINKDFKPVPYEEDKSNSWISSTLDVINRRLELIKNSGRRKGINIDFNKSLKSENINLNDLNESLKLQYNSFFGDCEKYYK